jgi:hypothetical protein
MSKREVIDRDERILWLASRLWRGHFNLFLKKEGIRWPPDPDNPYEFGGTSAEKEALRETNAQRRYFYELAAEIIDCEDEQADEEEWARSGFPEPQWKVTNPKHDAPVPAAPGLLRLWKPKDDGEK